MFVGKADKLPYIDSRAVADEGKLIGKRYLHIPAGILCQFAHFGCARVGMVQTTFHKKTVKFGGTLRGFLIDTSDHPVVVHQFIEDISRKHTLGTVCYMQFAAQFGAQTVYQFRHTLGCAYGGRTFDNVQIVFLQERNNCTGGTLYKRYIGSVIALERSGHHNKIGVGCFGY